MDAGFKENPYTLEIRPNPYIRIGINIIILFVIIYYKLYNAWSNYKYKKNGISR